MTIHSQLHKVAAEPVTPEDIGVANFLDIRIFGAGDVAQTLNVNSATYISKLPLSFTIDLDAFLSQEYRVIIRGVASVAGQTVTVQLATNADPTTPIHTGGDDVIITDVEGIFDSGWISRDDAATGFQEYTLALKGSNGTVDLLASYIDVLLKW